MARRDVVDDILTKLEPWLEQKKQEWQQQPEESREPTLPVVLGNKVNVRAIAIAIGLKTTNEQHFFKNRH